MPHAPARAPVGKVSCIFLLFVERACSYYATTSTTEYSRSPLLFISYGVQSCTQKNKLYFCEFLASSVISLVCQKGKSMAQNSSQLWFNTGSLHTLCTCLLLIHGLHFPICGAVRVYTWVYMHSEKLHFQLHLLVTLPICLWKNDCLALQHVMQLWMVHLGTATVKFLHVVGCR